MSTTINFGTNKDNQVKICHPSLADNTVRHTTEFFRSDMDWSALSDFILKSPIRDIYIGASADGSEACSLKMLLEKKAPRKKFFITAFDIAKKQIEKAQKGVIDIWEITPYDRNSCLDKCHMIVGKNIFNKNFQKIPRTDYDLDLRRRIPKGAKYSMTPHLLKNVSFVVQDAVEFSKQKFEKPIVFMFRNVLPYLKTSAQEEIVHNLEQNLPPNSLFVTGNCEQRLEPINKLRMYEEHFEQVWNNSMSRIFRHK